jgi:class 3 adenylate cyclase/tetratricopeptide (TPR) repeat protein
MNIACPSCGHETPEGFPRCANCGAPLSAEAAPVREERKIVTVLFCDLVGSTARAEGADPEDVRALLSAYHERVRRELERFGGTVEKFIGDAVMALFGAPTAHEDDPERAVRAAFAIREWATEDGDLQVRIGITTGEALVSLGARPEAGEGMASGDVVNTSARLQSSAPVNGILVDETTQRASRGVIEYAEHEPVTAKGKTEPVQVWSAAVAYSRPGVEVRQHATSALVGRERELDQLTDALERVQAERSPQLLTLVGAPGIGKSRLVFELMQHVEREPDLASWRQGRSLPYGEGGSFWALAEIVKAQAGILESDPPDQASAKLHRAVSDLLADEDAQWVERHLRPLAGFAAEGDVSQDRHEEEAFAAWRRFLEALAERRPLVLVFEDLHWADDGTLDFVDHLVDWATGVPIFVVCTARPELLDRRPGWGGGKLNASTQALSPLGDQDTARLISEVLARPVLSAETQSALLERAGGNPLYAEQFARLYLERGSAGGLPMPETVQGIVGARLDALPAEEKEVLQDASVLGKVFWTGALHGEPDVLRRALHSLDRKGFVRREPRSLFEGEDEHAFSHLLVREVAYGQIPRAVRAEKHRHAAEWIESLGRSESHAEMLAHHYSAALELAQAAGVDTAPLEEPARLALRGAGERAFGLNAFAVAADSYAKALQLWPDDDPARARLLLSYGKALCVAEERGVEMLVQARDALLAQADLESAAEAEAAAGEFLWEHAKAEPASQHLTNAVELLRDRPASASKAYALISLSRLKAFTGGETEAIALAREALGIAEELGLDELRARALNYIGSARLYRGDEAGMDDLDQSLALALAANAPRDALRAYNNLAGFTWERGGIARSRELLSDGLGLAERLGFPAEVKLFRVSLAVDAMLAGRWDEAVDLTDELYAVGFIRIARGEAEAVLAEAETEIETVRGSGRAQYFASALTFHAYALLAAERPDDAREVIGEAMKVLPANPREFADWWQIAAIVCSAVQGTDELLAALKGARPTPWVETATLYAVGDFEGAAEGYAKLGAASMEAYAHLRAAEKCLAEGRRVEADTQLEKALTFYRAVGATHFIREGEALLAESA